MAIEQYSLRIFMRLTNSTESVARKFHPTLLKLPFGEEFVSWEQRKWEMDAAFDSGNKSEWVRIKDSLT